MKQKIYHFREFVSINLKYLGFLVVAGVFAFTIVTLLAKPKSHIVTKTVTGTITVKSKSVITPVVYPTISEFQAVFISGVNDPKSKTNIKDVDCIHAIENTNKYICTYITYNGKCANALLLWTPNKQGQPITLYQAGSVPVPLSNCHSVKQVMAYLKKG